MATKIFDLYGDLKLKGTKEVENGLKDVESKADKSSKVLSRSFVNSTGKLGGFRSSLKQTEGGLGRFTDSLGDATGATGKLGNLIGQLGESMLTGGIFGIALTAAAAGVSYLIQKSQDLSKSLETAFSKIVKFKSAFDNVQFEITANDLNKINEELKTTIQELENLSQSRGVTEIGNSINSWLGLYPKLTEAEKTRLTANTKVQEKMQEQLETLEAQQLIYDVLAGKVEDVRKRLLAMDINKASISDLKKLLPILEELKEDVPDPTGWGAQMVKYYQERINAVNKLLERFEVEKTKIKTLDDIEKERINNIRKGVDAVKNSLTQLRASKVDVDTILTPKSLDNLKEDFNKWKEDNKEEFTIETIMKPVKDTKKPTEPDVSVSEGELFGLTPEQFLEMSEAELTLMETNYAVAKSYESLAETIGMVQGAFGEHTAMYKAAAIIEATVATFLAATKALATVPFPFGFAAAAAITAAGIANIAKITGAAHGGTFEGGKKIGSFARGGDFMVPNYFPGDSYMMGVQTGERVTVTPAGQVGSEAKILSKVASKLDAVNRNLASVQSEIRSQKLEVNIDGKNIVKKTLKPAENRLRQAGVNLDEL